MERIALCAVIGWLMILAGNTVMANPTSATNKVSRLAQDRRALADCMTKRMGASRTISYYQAAQVCKDQMKSRQDGLAANNEVRPATGRP